MKIISKKTLLKSIVLSFVLLGSVEVMAQETMHDICPLKVGAEVPAGTLEGKEKKHKLSELTKSKPSVLIFYRGAWCGYCVKHLAELNTIKDEVKELGYEMFGITVDQASKLKESDIQATNEIPVYSDADLDVIKGFGLDWEVSEKMYTKYKESYELDLEDWSGEEHHRLPVPAIFIVKDGVVEFQYVNPNYSKRLKPATLLAVLKTL